MCYASNKSSVLNYHRTIKTFPHNDHVYLHQSYIEIYFFEVRRSADALYEKSLSQSNRGLQLDNL